MNGGTAIKLVNVAKDLGMQQYVANSSLGVGKSDSAHFCNIPESVASKTKCDCLLSHQSKLSISTHQSQCLHHKLRFERQVKGCVNAEAWRVVHLHDQVPFCASHIKFTWVEMSCLMLHSHVRVINTVRR